MTWNVNLLNISIFDTHTVYSYQISINAGYFVLLYEYVHECWYFSDSNEDMR